MYSTQQLGAVALVINTYYLKQNNVTQSPITICAITIRSIWRKHIPVTISSNWNIKAAQIITVYPCAVYIHTRVSCKVISKMIFNFHKHMSLPSRVFSSLHLLTPQCKLVSIVKFSTADILCLSLEQTLNELLSVSIIRFDSAEMIACLDSTRPSTISGILQTMPWISQWLLNLPYSSPVHSHFRLGHKAGL